jgi:hypothetical protein
MYCSSPNPITPMKTVVHGPGTLVHDRKLGIDQGSENAHIGRPPLGPATATPIAQKTRARMATIPPRGSPGDATG